MRQGKLGYGYRGRHTIVRGTDAEPSPPTVLTVTNCALVEVKSIVSGDQGLHGVVDDPEGTAECGGNTAASAGS